MARYWTDQTTDGDGETIATPPTLHEYTFIQVAGTFDGATVTLSVRTDGLDFYVLDNFNSGSGAGVTEPSALDVNIPPNSDFKFNITGATTNTSISVSYVYPSDTQRLK